MKYDKKNTEMCVLSLIFLLPPSQFLIKNNEKKYYSVPVSKNKNERENYPRNNTNYFCGTFGFSSSTAL